jgi:SOS-response transcriptional repressor LexA
MPRPRLIPAKDVLRALRQSIAKTGYMPTVRELKAILGVGSTRTVFRYLRALEVDGYITRLWPGARAGVKFARRKAAK